MKNFTVELYTVEWCGYSEYYEVLAECEDRAEDAALEECLDDFTSMYDMILTENGEYEVSGEEEDGTSMVLARVIA